MTTSSRTVSEIALAVNMSLLPICIVALVAGKGDVVHACATASCMALGVHLGAVAYGRIYSKEVTNG